jgi:flavin reductase ActVB
MSRLAKGVVVVMTRDASGALWGFTATSLCSVSLHPPLILACVALSSSSYPAFMSCQDFAVSVLHENHGVTADRFARSGSDKFRGEALTLTPQRQPTLSDALCRLDCRVHSRHHAGDHTILIGQVLGVSIAAGEPLVHFRRNFRTLAPRLPAGG